MKTPAQKIRTEIHKNSHRMDMQELLELSEKLTECIDMKLRLLLPFRAGDLGKLEKYASEEPLRNYSKAVLAAEKNVEAPQEVASVAVMGRNGIYYITKNKFDKLPDCELRNSNMVTFMGGYKFLRRGKVNVTLLVKCKRTETMPADYMEVSYKCDDVKIDGKPLEYIRFLTNTKQPFKK